MARSKLTALVRCLTLAASVGAPCLAAAADLLPPPASAPASLRRSRSAAASICAAMSAPASTTARNTPAAYDYTGYSDSNRSFANEIGGGGFAGVGVGYQFTPFFRGDVTGEYRYATGLRGSEYYRGPDYDDGLGSYGVNKSSGHFDSAVVLANAYFDLGTWYGVTPFIGAGAGYAFNHMSGYGTDSTFTSPSYGYDYSNPVYASRRRLPLQRAGVLQLRPGLRRQRQPGLQDAVLRRRFYKDKTTGSFAWALHAGLAYNITDAFKIELAYRYLNLGKAETGAGYDVLLRRYR